jgi:HlyD family secretion protein
MGSSRVWRTGAALLGLLVLGGCAGAPAATTAQTTPAATSAPARDRVVAEAKVVPVQSANLSFSVSGTVAEILAREGQAVQADAPLVRLESRGAALRVEQAQAELERAKASYAQLTEGASPEAVSSAEAQVAQAEAALRQTRGGVTAQDVAAARAQLEQARALLARLLSGPKQTELARAYSQLDQAQANLTSQRDALSLAKTNAELQLSQAANALRNAQDSYSRLYWDNRDLENNGIKLTQEQIDAEAAAKRAVEDADAAMTQARVTAAQAGQAERSGVAAAETRVRDAEAALKQLQQGSEADQIAAARAQVAQAQANLSKLLGDERAGQVAAADAVVRRTRADLEQLTAKPRDPQLALGLAEVHAAEVGLKQAQLDLDQLTLRAPFAGTVAELTLKVGEAVSPNTPALVLADLSSWQIETDDLTELSVVKIAEGQTVRLSFDALPKLTLEGTVARIKPIGKNRQGDMTYTVVVAPKSWDPRLRWNMTATVEILPPAPGP